MIGRLNGISADHKAFNTFNTPWFGLANTSLGNARFGLLGNTQGNDPRNTQIALKLNF